MSCWQRLRWRVQVRRLGLSKGAKMRESQAYLEKVQTKLRAVSARETVLIQALRKALSEADHCLLDDLRALTIEHETRRTMIQSELQNLGGPYRNVSYRRARHGSA